MGKYSDDSSSGDEYQAEDAKVGMKQELVPGAGIVKECLVEGSGFARPTKGCKVTVHYVGTLADGGKEFDSSRGRGEPFTFELGVGGVIKGWDVGVATMRKGEKSILTCKADYAYGAQGSPPTIPPNATLNFEVELLYWVETIDISEARDMSILKKIIKEAKNWKKPEYESECVVTIKEVDAEAEPLDMSDEAEPEKQTVVIGNEDVTSSMETALLSMKAEEISRVTFVNDGNKSYQIRLHSLTNPSSRYELTADQRISEAKTRKDAGNALYKDKKMERAQKKYKKALEYLDDDFEASAEQKKEASDLKLPCLTNLAAVELFIGDNAGCIATCTKALGIDSKNPKALLRRAKAYNNVDSWQECRRDLDNLLLDDPKHADALKELEKVKKKQKAQDARDKKAFAGLFK